MRKLQTLQCFSSIPGTKSDQLNKCPTVYNVMEQILVLSIITWYYFTNQTLQRTIRNVGMLINLLNYTELFAGRSLLS
jgi:hypothetical protein